MVKVIKINFRNLLIYSFVFLIAVTWIFSDWPRVWRQPFNSFRVKEVEAKVAPLRFGKNIVNFVYTDDNSGENLIIKTNKKTYIGLTRANVYFSVTNIGRKSQKVDLQAYFPEKDGEVEKISKWKEGIPYEANIPDYGPISYFCESGWQEKTKTVDLEEPILFYYCTSTQETRYCDQLNDNKDSCIRNNVSIGIHKETRYKNKWISVSSTNSYLKNVHNFIKNLPLAKEKEKLIPGNFRVKKSTDQSFVIVPNQTQYFKAVIKFSPRSSGQFYIEAVGDNGGYGLLDPWWNSSWSYRIPITIDNSNNSNNLSNHQLYIQLTSSQSNFWSHVNSDGSDVRFIASDNSTELNYWQQYWDYSNKKADFWVQVNSVPASSTSTIYIYYGSEGASSESDPGNTFSYSSMQDLFYVVRSDLSGASVEVVSLVDNNQVQLDSQTPVTLNKGELANFGSPASTSVLRVKGPVHAKLIGGPDYDALVPISFASTQFVIPSTRGTENFYIYAPFATSTVTIYDGTTQEQQNTVSPGTSWTVQNDISTMAIVEATEPVLLAFDNSSPYDGMSIYPATIDDLYGIESTKNYVGIAADSTNFSIYCSGGGSVNVSNQSRGTLYNDSTCNNGAEGTGGAVRIAGINHKIGSIQQADSDGGESTVFLPPKEFGTEYAVPTNCAYLAVACTPDEGTVDLSVYDENNNFVTSSTCSGSGNDPGKAYFGDADATSYNAGSRIVSTNGKPFYVYYEDTTATGASGGDENNLWSWPQSRKYSYPQASYSFGSEEHTTEPVLNQDYYRWYANSDSITPSDPWPSGGTDLDENEAISQDYSVKNGDVLRLRMSVQVSNTDFSANSQDFKLQYGQGSDCSAISNWYDVGQLSSSTIWRGYDNPTPSDGDTLSSLLLSVSDVAESYEEENKTVNNPNAIGTNQDGEWDWVIQDNGAARDTEYCFRMVKGDGNSLNSYTNYPQLITNTPPGVPEQNKPFNNEKVASTTPSFEFSSIDSSGDDIVYQIEWDTNYDFSSVIEKTSDADPGFEDLTNASDTSPFASGDTIKFTIQSSDMLSNNTTYWWRVRAKDPNGSDVWSDWSSERNFTVDTSVIVPTWYQTTDEQFRGDTLNNAIITGDNSVRTHTIFGEYGTVVVTSSDYSMVNLNNYYNNLIVVASPRYSGSNELARSVRVKDKTNKSFKIKVDSYDGSLDGTTTVVDWIAMDSGAWNIENGNSGTKIIAGTKNVSALGGHYSSVSWDPSEIVVFNPSFNGTPIVLHTVSSDNDTSWITSHVDDGSTYQGDPTANQMGLILNYSKTPNNNHGPEYIDYIAADQATGTNNGINFAIVKSSDSVEGYLDSPPYNVSYNNAFSSPPEVSVIAQLGEDGGDGSWAITYGTPTQTDDPVAVDEANSTSDRKHTTEPVGVMAFDAGGRGNIKQYNADNGSSVSTGINFSDGSDRSSHWGQFSWNDEETNGSIKYQIEYSTGSTWSLIPDSDLSGNSAGFNSSPVDLSNLSTTTYSHIRVKADLNYSNGSPILQDWTVTWSNQPPVIKSISINPDPIDLSADTTTVVTITATIYDANGCNDVFTNGSIKGVFYDADVTSSSCTSDDNVCYPNLTLTEVGNTCSGSEDTTADASINVPVWFIADASNQWTARVTATDSQSQSDSDIKITTINELIAFKLDVSNINYGLVNPDEVSSAEAIKITTIGNTAVDVKLSGDDLVQSSQSVPVGQQKYASTSNFDWDTQGIALTKTPTCYELSTGKPTTHPSNQSEYIYWKLKVPLNKSAQTYSGNNVFDVVADNSCP